MTNWIVAARRSDVRPDRVNIVTAGNRRLALYQIDGDMFASEAYCPHERECLDSGYVENGTVECALHYAVFDIRTGTRVSGPATRPLRTYPAKVEGDEILVDISVVAAGDDSGCITTCTD